MKRRTSLKSMLKKVKLLRIVGAHNGLTAKLVEEAGFDGVWASGLEISTSHALPDANILTMSDFLYASEDMVNSVSIPVVADCDTGYGNSNNVMQMVRKFESAGVSAVCIEDKKFPKVNSFVSGRQELAPIAEFAGKIMAAKNARATEDFMIFARTEALIAGWGMDEALRRAETYIGSGADGIFIHSKSTSSNEIIDFCKAWKKKAPLMICPTTYVIDEDKMKKLGVDIIIYANHVIRASIKHVQDVLRNIKRQGVAELGSKIVSMGEVFRLQGMHIMKNNEKKYLKSNLGSIKAVIPAAGSEMDDSLKPLLEDRPIAMLDINGKTLIARNIEALNIAGVQDINVITGYRGEKVDLEGVNIIKNKEFNTKGIMHSVIKGVDSIADKNIIMYSDIILDQYFLQNLLKRDGDIVLVVDGTYKKANARNKKLELVKAKFSPADNLRSIDTNRKNPICRIGKDFDEKNAHFEFAGVALLSKKGMESLLKEYSKTKLPNKASFADFIQHMINKGYEAVAYEVTSGWMEIHNLDDYKKACSIFS